MDNKKIIGAILGVVAFIALVAGATFAWLTATVTVNNGTYVGNIKNFVISYTGGSAVGANLVIIDKADAKAPKIKNGASAASVENDGWVQVKASKTANDVEAAHFHIMLNISTNTITTNSLVWAACRSDQCPADTTALISAINTSAGNPAGSSPTATCASNVQCGVVKAGQTTSRTSYASNTDIVLYDDTSTFNVYGAVAEKTYNVYFWFDGPTFSNSDFNTSIVGNIYAEAIQKSD